MGAQAVLPRVTMYLWCQCLFFFCAIVCSDAYRERALSNNSLNFQTIEKSISKTLLKYLQHPDVQHPVNQLPFWKLQAVSDVPSRYPISHQYRHVLRPQKWYNGRLIKRAVENQDTFMIAFKAAIKEAVREFFAENKKNSAQSNMAELWSRVHENTGRLPSDTEVNFLRRIGFHSEDTSSEHMNEPQPSLEHSTSELAQGIQIWTTMRSLLSSKPEGTSVDLSNEQISLKFQPELQTQKSVTTLPSGTTQIFHYSNTTNAEKSKTYTEVTTAPSSRNTFNLRHLTLSDSQSSETQESLKSITKDPFTVVTNPVLESSTIGNIPTSSFKTSAENVDSAELPIIEKYTTDPGLVDLTMTISADLFSSAGESLSPIIHSLSPIQHYIPQKDHTSSPNFMSANPYTKHDWSQSTFEDSKLSILSTNGKLADVYNITSSKEKLVPSLKMERTTVTSIRPDFSATQMYTPETSEITGNKEDSANTAGTLLSSTLSSPKHFSSTEGNIASTEAASFETNYEMLSTVTPLPIMGGDDPTCVLKVRNATTTMQMPLTEQTTYENDGSIHLARIKTSLNPKSEMSFTSALSPTELTSTVALSPFTDLYSTDPKEEDLSIVPLDLLVDTHFPEPTKLDPTETFSSFTDEYSASPEPTKFPQTTLSLTDYDTFDDAMNGNENSNQMTSDVTRTKSSTFLPFLFSTTLISMTQSWKSASPFIQTERFAALQTAAKRQGFKANSTTKNVQLYSSSHMTSQSQAIPSTSRVHSSFSQYATSSSTLNPFLTISHSRSQRTGKHLSSTRASKASTKVWKPLSSVGPTSIIHAERSVAFQTAADSQGYNLSTMSPKSSIFYSSTYITPRSQTIPSRTHMMSAVSHPVTSTALNALFTLPQSRNQTTISSTSTSEKHSQTSTPKIWKPQSSVVPSKSSTSAIPPSRSTIFGAPPLRSTSDVLPPKSTTGTFPSKSSTFGAHTERNSSLTITKRQRYPTATTTPKFSTIYSSTLISRQSQVIPSTKHGKFSLPQFVTYTSTHKPQFTVSPSKTKTMTPKSFIRTSAKTPETPAFKGWIPQASYVIPTKLATSVPAMGKSLPEIQTMPHATSSSTSAVGTVPLTFHLTGVSYSEQLSNHTTDAYKNLEKEVLLVVNKVFATKYQKQFLQAQILRFSKGSVVVISKVLFGSRSSTPSGSDIVRTVLSDDYATKNNYFGWKINASTVECKGYTPWNLEQESLSISFIVLHFGFIAITQNYQEKHNYLESLQEEILRAINTSFQVTNISFLQIRDFHGDLEVRGILYLASSKFTNVQVLLSTLLPLANGSIDLRSFTVEGMHNELKVYPFNFRVTNMQFAVRLLDMASIESQKLSKDLSNVIELALHDNSLLQVVIQEFYSGSVVCKGDLIYRFPAPGSGEVLRQFLQALTSDGMLGSSSYKVDFQSVTIDDSTSSPYNEYTDFPGFAVAIIVMCGLSILIFPLLVFVCYKTRMLGHRNKATIRQRHDPGQQSHHLEMDNRAFRASIEQP